MLPVAGSLPFYLFTNLIPSAFHTILIFHPRMNEVENIDGILLKIAERRNLGIDEKYCEKDTSNTSILHTLND